MTDDRNTYRDRVASRPDPASADMGVSVTTVRVDDDSKPTPSGLVLKVTRVVLPILFLALLAASLTFAWRTAGDIADTTGWNPQQTSLEARLELAWRDAPPAGVTPDALWLGALDDALDPARGGQPDLTMARSVLSSLVPLLGSDVLALEVLDDGIGRASLEADLRARPAWQRRQRLDGALAEGIERAQRLGLDPAELAFAPELLRERFDRATRLYARTASAMERWFLDPAGRSLSLNAMPGWSRLLDTPVELRGEIETLILHGCGLLDRRGERPVGCRSADLPRVIVDETRFQLAALTFVLQESAETGSTVHTGARLLGAASAAGRLHPSLAQLIARDPALTDQLLADLTPMLEDAAGAYSDPVRARLEAARLLQTASRRFEQDRLVALSLDVAGLRRDIGADATLRLLALARDTEDVRRLRQIAGVAGPATLALFEFNQGREAELLALVDRPGEIVVPASRNFFLALLCAMGAILILVVARVRAVHLSRQGSGT